MSRSKLLLVDDEPEILELLCQIFEDHDCATALQTEAAIESLRKRPCDVLITDIRMPGKSGLHLIEWTRQNLPDVPIIVITGHFLETSELEKNPIFRWINKPFRRNAIREAVAAALISKNGPG